MLNRYMQLNCQRWLWQDWAAIGSRDPMWFLKCSTKTCKTLWIQISGMHSVLSRSLSPAELSSSGLVILRFNQGTRPRDALLQLPHPPLSSRQRRSHCIVNFCRNLRRLCSFIRPMLPYDPTPVSIPPPLYLDGSCHSLELCFSALPNPSSLIVLPMLDGNSELFPDC